MSIKTCCVLNCLARSRDDTPLHRFPKPDSNQQRFQDWITNIGGELSTLDPTFVFKNRRVCHQHFDPVYHYAKNRLCATAVPTLNLSATTTFNCSIDTNMDDLSDHNYTDNHYLTPVMSRDIAYNDINIKVERDLSAEQGIIPTEDVFHDIKAENEDHDVEYGSTTTKDFVTDDIKVEAIQEIITPEKFTNIEMMCGSTLPTDVALNSVKIEDYSVMNQDGASESETNTDVKRENVLFGEDYSSDNGLPSAVTIHKVESSYTGVQQVTKVPDDSTRLRDVAKHSGKKPFTYEVCRKTYSKQGNLAAHVWIHSEEKEYTCEVCHKTYTRQGNLAAHMRIHSGEKSFSCNICHKAFKLKCSLSGHIRVHTGEKPFPCDICDKAFTAKHLLYKHRRRIHTAEKPFSCHFCTKSFVDSSNLVRHIRVHSGEKPFSCNICDKAFKVKSSFLGHIRVHTGEKPFPCDICDKAFNSKHLLYKHRRIHTGEKPFSCHICTKSFVNKSNFVRHIRRVHSGEKPFTCEVCHKAFSQRSSLISHMGVHSGIKPFSCDICKKAFSVKDRLVHHIRLHSKVKPFSCEVCDKTFSKKDKLTSHMSVH